MNPVFAANPGPIAPKRMKVKKTRVQRPRLPSHVIHNKEIRHPGYQSGLEKRKHNAVRMFLLGAKQSDCILSVLLKDVKLMIGKMVWHTSWKSCDLIYLGDRAMCIATFAKHHVAYLECKKERKRMNVE